MIPLDASGQGKTSFACRVQAVPMGFEDVSFQVEGVEMVRYNAGQQAKRPFLFPVKVPSGRRLTRMGHPHDIEGHRHHHSVWLAHQLQRPRRHRTIEDIPLSGQDAGSKRR